MSPSKSGRVLPAYLAFTLGLSSVFYVLIAKSKTGGGEWVDYTGCLMWCPGIAAFLACNYSGRSMSTLGWKWGQTRYYAYGYLTPLGYVGVIYAFVWFTGFGGFPNPAFVDMVAKDIGFGPLPAWATIALYFFFVSTIAVIKNCATVLGEEIGWRGLLVPVLADRYGFAATAMISGIIWALWHYPLLLLGPNHSATPVWYDLPLFTITVVSINFLWTWMRLKSGSIWPCVLLHAAHNTFFQRFFDPFTAYGSRTPYVAGEFGAALTVVSVLIAVYLTSRLSPLPPVRHNS
ncbi:MAG: CPBP family intramembrane glutamic endopeptidase [Bryobacteraceae bacterium]